MKYKGNKNILFCVFMVAQISCFSQIKLGDSLNMRIIRKQVILVSPNQLDNGYLVEKENITYSICVNSSNKIYFISTDDSNFSFQGLRIGTPFRKIKNITNQYSINGWGYVVENKDEWKYLFDTVKIKSKSKIALFFKYDPELGTSSK